MAFSGGCDSSLILAAATSACRKLGRPDPVPVTYRYANAPGADERDFQELAIRYLHLREWLVIDLDDDGDILSAAATAALQKFGLVWPPGVLGHASALRQLDEGTLLSGEGGDELFGSRRVSAIASAARLARHRHAPCRKDLRDVLEALGPRRFRQWLSLRQLDRDYPTDWLTLDVRQRLLGVVAHLLSAEPLGARDYFQYEAALPWSNWASQHPRGPRRVRDFGG